VLGPLLCVVFNPGALAPGHFAELEHHLFVGEALHAFTISISMPRNARIRLRLILKTGVSTPFTSTTRKRPSAWSQKAKSARYVVISSPFGPRILNARWRSMP